MRRTNLKFDLHCHTKEGSLDAKVSVREYADRFLSLGYDGFMISDHNSYKGCRAWDKIKAEPQYSNFTVIRGIEYDTKDAGHVLIIMPDDLYLNIFRIRGMKCRKLIHLVHAFGGVLGLAHPYGVASSSAMGFKQMDMTLLDKFDFIETFNTCETSESNKKAKALAEKHDLPALSGSDSHVTDYIGMACTEIQARITCNNDLIKAIKERAEITAFGVERGETKKAKRKEHWLGILGFRLYNRGIGKLVCPYRKFKHRKLHNHIVHTHG